jgi:hypothetical protein
LLYAKTANTIVLSWSDMPYNNWSSPQNIISESADYPFSAAIDGNGHLYIAYTQQTSLNLIYLKLSFGAGVWIIGTPVTICNAGPCYYPAIARKSAVEMWCAYSYYDSGQNAYTVRTKVSYDNGATWGAGPGDTGTQLSESNVAMPYVALVLAGSNLYAVYSQARSNLYYRFQAGSDGSWDDPVLILSADYIDADFDCGVSSDMKLGFAICPSTVNKIYFREYDGVNLGGLQEAAQHKGRTPQISYLSGRAHLFYAKYVGGDFWIPTYAVKEAAAFAGNDLLKGIGLFDKVLVYDDTAMVKYEDKTIESASISSADVYHSSSNALLAAIGDCLYLGMADKFFCCAIILSTAASGGNVVWEYFNGSAWVEFTPESGVCGFDQSSQLVNFWADLDSAPGSWQCCLVNTHFLYWIRARVSNAFTTAPIGSQIMAAARPNHFVKTEEAN